MCADQSTAPPYSAVKTLLTTHVTMQYSSDFAMFNGHLFGAYTQVPQNDFCIGLNAI